MPACGRELDHLGRAQVEPTAMQRAGHDAAVKSAERQRRGHVRAAIVDDADALLGVDNEKVEIAPRHAAHRARRQLVQRGDGHERCIGRAGGQQVVRYGHRRCVHDRHLIDRLSIAAGGAMRIGSPCRGRLLRDQRTGRLVGVGMCRPLGPWISAIRTAAYESTLAGPPVSRVKVMANDTKADFKPAMFADGEISPLARSSIGLLIASGT